MTNAEPRNNASTNSIEMDGIDETNDIQPELEELEVVTTTKVPWLQEVVLSVTKLLILVVTVAVIALSINARVGLWLIFVRASVTILLMGFLGFLVNWFLGKYLVEAKVNELREKIEAEDALEAERLVKEQAELENLEMLQQQELEDNHLEIES